VSELSFLGSRGQHTHHYRATLRPWLWFLSRASNCRIFQNMTVPEIIMEVFRSHDFEDFRLAPLTGQYSKQEFLVQYRESDLDFVSRLMEEIGLYYYFEHEAQLHTLVLCDDAAAHTAADGCAELPYHPPDRQRAEHIEYISHWEEVSRVATSACAARDFDFQRPKALLSARGSYARTHALGDFEIYDYPGAFSGLEQGNARMHLRAEEHCSGARRSTGRSNARNLSCGRQLTMRGHTLEEYDQTYLVLSTVIHIEGHAVESGSVEERELVSVEFVAQQSQQPFRLARITPKPVVHGAQTAIVAGPQKQQIFTDEHGRVRVKFHWDRRGVTDERASCWVRVSQLWAGAGFGAMHIPRIGQEVIVEFLEGDPDRPIIVGRVYNGDNAPPYELSQHQTQTGIRSASINGTLSNFNEIRFEDREGAEELYIQAERNKTERVKASRSSSIGSHDSLQVGGDQSITVKGNLTVDVGAAGGNYTLAAARAVVVTAPEFIELKCGDSTLRIDPKQIILSAGAGASLTLDSNVLELAKGGATLILDESVNAMSKAGSALSLKATVRAHSPDGKTQLVLEDGKAQLDSSGSIDITGRRVQLNC
jgi:type VI secretion system secreted protein VgrG